VQHRHRLIMDDLHRAAAARGGRREQPGQAAFVPATNGGQRFAAVPMLVVLAWGVVGLLVAVRTFSWVPRRA
jgi:hypothetical protein